MKKVYLVVTPSGRSVYSIRADPRKAFNKTKTRALKVAKAFQKFFRVKLRVKGLIISNKIYRQHF